MWENLWSAGASLDRWSRWLYTGSPGTPDDVYGEALNAAGSSYTANAGLAHQALRNLGSLGALTSSALALIEGDELHYQIMNAQADADVAALENGAPNSEPWNTSLLRAVRDNSSKVMMAVQLLDGPKDEAGLRQLADGLMAQARSRVLGELQTYAVNVVRDKNENRLGEIDELLKSGQLTAAQETELLAQEAFLLQLEDDILNFCAGTRDLDPATSIANLLTAIEGTVTAELARLDTVPPAVLDGVGAAPLAINMPAQRILLQGLAAIIPNLRGALPKIVLVSDIVRFYKDDLQQAIEQAQQEAANPVMMGTGNQIILRPEIPHAVAENGTHVYGSAQNTTGALDDPHALAINAKVQELIDSGEYESVGMNLSWRTMTGRQNTCRNRPDIIAVKRDGSILAIEFKSVGQQNSVLQSRLDAAENTWVGGQGPSIATDIRDVP